MAANLGKLERVPLREAWKNEASDFTPWLAEESNLEHLAESLGLSELVLIGTEHWAGDFKIDLLCSSENEQVIIENQLEKTDHSHLGQVLTYAAYVGAKKIVWIAETFRTEHVAAIEFLNQNTTDDLSFFAVEVELWRIDASPLAPKFEVVAKPNEWSKSGREYAKAATSSSPAKQTQLRLWTLVGEKMRAHQGIAPQAARPQHWMNVSIGRAGFKISLTASHRDDKLGAAIYINHNSSKFMFNALRAQQSEIEASLGFELDWQELPDAHACRIATWRNNSPLDDERSWPDYCDWFVEKTGLLNRVFRPRIAALDEPAD